jgi:hypothetical protein
MAFAINYTDGHNGLYTITLHDTAGPGNRVVHVIAPHPGTGRETAAQLQAHARASAKKALQDALLAL